MNQVKIFYDNESTEASLSLLTEINKKPKW